jgi:hypothetical protein
MSEPPISPERETNRFQTEFRLRRQREISTGGYRQVRSYEPARGGHNRFFDKPAGVPCLPVGLHLAPEPGSRCPCRPRRQTGRRSAPDGAPHRPWPSSRLAPSRTTEKRDRMDRAWRPTAWLRCEDSNSDIRARAMHLKYCDNSLWLVAIRRQRPFAFELRHRGYAARPNRVLLCLGVAQDPDPEVKGKRAGHGNGGEER